MPPFLKANQLVRDLEPQPGASQSTSLPGQPSISLNDLSLTKKFLEYDLWSDDLERIAPRLWIMTTTSSANVNPLHRQRVKGREIVVTEDARLHLVWIHDRIFIKPIPRYLLSHVFWETYLDRQPGSLNDERSNLRKAAAGFLRTYRYLVQHESDFHVAQQDNLRLIPKDVDWATFCRFTSDLHHIDDSAVSGRYCFGELRLTRLNLYAPLLLRKFHFEQVHGQYGDYFARFYGPVLFVFAVVSTILNSMQVALAADQPLAVHWVPVWHVSRWFSVVSLVATAVIAVCFVVLWLWMFLDEWVYTVRRRLEERRKRRDGCRC
ncbi:hypothetical protein BDW02DRAFT_575134 [Decorospora gaudefroyi]|uniref:Subtilisin-like serine protease n=1 Tax=Decorospora gaudefroyi TaxID=184978 RepID=A0A6A5K1P4_9PLEO|nr:hypothetical protein BDW02DRAFT_575134 [Decorospora gaudefroyi]